MVNVYQVFNHGRVGNPLVRSDDANLAVWQFGTCAKGFIGRIIVDHQQGAHRIEPDGGSEDPDRATAMILLVCIGTSSPMSAGCST